MSKEDGKGTLVVTYREDEGEVDRRRLAGIMGAATTVMMLFLVIALSLGMVGAALGVGMGGFVASFGNVDVDVEGDSGSIYPVLGDQPACDEAPQLMANLQGTAEVTEHVAFFKDLPAPAAVDVDTVRINIVADEIDEGDVEIDNLELRLSALSAAQLDIDAEDADDDVDISEFTDFGDDNGDAQDSYGVDDGDVQSLNADELSDNVEFGIAIPEDSNVVIDDGLAAAHQVSFESITLPNVDLFITMDDDGQFEGETGVEDRSVAPADRVCSELAAESGPESYTGEYPTSE